MRFSSLGMHDPESWRSWHRRNVTVTETGVTVAREPAPTYISPSSLLADSDIAPVDLAVDECDRRYYLTADGYVYRQSPDDSGLERLDCLWQPSGKAQALCITADTLYIAGGDPPRVQAYSRELWQTRWIIDDVIDPVAFAIRDGIAYLLDRGERTGTGRVVAIHRTARIVTIATGFYEPIDITVDRAGGLYVLDRGVRDDQSAPVQYMVRVFDPEMLATPPADATDTIRVPPAGFRVTSTDERFIPGSIAVRDVGELVVGADPAWEGEQTLFRYRPASVSFDRVASYRRGTSALLHATDGSELYAVDGDGDVVRLTARNATKRDPALGGFNGELITRVDGGEIGTHWHRVVVDLVQGGPGTEVRLSYRATDADRPTPPEPRGDPPEVSAIDGIGPRHARRLATAGITDVAALAEADPESVSAVLGVEEIAVAPETTADWLAQARNQLAESPADVPGIETIDGIGPTYAMRLQDAGIDDLADLVDWEADELARIAGSELRDVAPERAAEWIRAAEAMVGPDPDVDSLAWQSIRPSNPEDALLDGAEGRYLWLKLELIGAKFDAPVVRSVRALFPRQSYLRHLPALYREDEVSADFLERFLSLFESVFTDIEADIEGLTSYLDSAGIPAEPGHLDWLGSWIGAGLDEYWPETARRKFIERAPELYRMRGTRRGLLETIDLYLDYVEVDRVSWERALAQEADRLDELVAAGRLTRAEAEAALTQHEALSEAGDERLVRVVEAADLDCLESGPARVPYSRLIDTPQGFLVLLHPALDAEHVRAIGGIVEAQCPAHATGRPVDLHWRTILADADPSHEPGYHTYLGINTTLPEREFALSHAQLGLESVLGSREPDGHLGVRARLGEDTRIS